MDDISVYNKSSYFIAGQNDSNWHWIQVNTEIWSSRNEFFSLTDFQSCYYYNITPVSLQHLQTRQFLNWRCIDAPPCFMDGVIYS